MGEGLTNDSWDHSVDADLDGDGYAETRYYDTDGDGLADVADQDVNHDGVYDTTWEDRNEDGYADHAPTPASSAGWVDDRDAVSEGSYDRVPASVPVDGVLGDVLGSQAPLDELIDETLSHPSVSDHQPDFESGRVPLASDVSATLGYLNGSFAGLDGMIDDVTEGRGLTDDQIDLAEGVVGRSGYFDGIAGITHGNNVSTGIRREEAARDMHDQVRNAEFDEYIRHRDAEYEIEESEDLLRSSRLDQADD
jgi:hypothetical protein